MDTLDSGRRIELVGEYDLSQKAEIAALFGALAPDGPATIDMSQVSYVDSNFLVELLKLRKRLVHPITLLVRSEHIRRVLRIVNFEHLFEIKVVSDQ